MLLLKLGIACVPKMLTRARFCKSFLHESSTAKQCKVLNKVEKSVSLSTLNHMISYEKAI